MATKGKFPAFMFKSKEAKGAKPDAAKKKGNPFAKKFAAGGSVDGAAQRGKTKGKMC